MKDIHAANLFYLDLKILYSFEPIWFSTDMKFETKFFNESK